MISAMNAKKSILNDVYKEEGKRKMCSIKPSLSMWSSH